jgi:hypothetical protein
MTLQADVRGSGRQQLDTWHVKLANGETRALSLDELDAGFHEGWITGRTMVLAAGSSRWAPLGEVAGLDETPAPVASSPNSIAPFALDSFDVDVSMDSSSGADVATFRPRRGRTVLTVMTALAVIGGLGYAGFLGRPAVQRALASHGHTSSVSADAKATPPTPPPPAPILASPPSPAPANTVPTMGAASLPDAPPLTDAEKRAAAEAEKKAAAEAKKARRAAPKRAK